MIKARALDLDFFATRFAGKHAKLAYSHMHREFFANDRKHIDDYMKAAIGCEPFKGAFDYSELLSTALNAVRGWQEVYAAPRGNAKSTIKTRIEVMRDVVYELEPFIVIFSNTGGQAEGRVWEIMRELSIGGNKDIEKYFGKISGEYTKRDKRVWSRSHFITCTGVRVMAASMMSESRGIADGENRPTKVVYDDLENNEHVHSPVQREKANDWFTKVPLKLGGPNMKCNHSLAGTIIHRNSLLANLLKNPGWKGKKYQAIRQWPSNQTLWNECQQVFIDLDNANRKEDARAFYEANKAAMDEGAEVLWHAGEPLYDLMVMLWTDGAASFNSEKQNDPRDPSKQILSLSEHNWFKLKQNRFGAWEIHRPDERIVNLTDCSVVGWLDPAMAKEKATDPDYASIVVLAIDSHGYGYVLDVWMKQVIPSKYLPQIPQFHKKYWFDNFGIEDNGFQELLRDPLDRICRQLYEDEKQAGYRGKPYWNVPVRGYTQTSNKVQRIQKLEAPITNGWLLFNENLPKDFIEQIETFPTASHDDGPDALEGAWTLGTQRSYTPAGGNYR